MKSHLVRAKVGKKKKIDKCDNFALPFKFRRPFFSCPEFCQFRGVQRVSPEFFQSTRDESSDFPVLLHTVWPKKTDFQVFQIPDGHLDRSDLGKNSSHEHVFGGGHGLQGVGQGLELQGVGTMKLEAVFTVEGA